MAIKKYRVWLKEVELLSVEIEAVSSANARRKIEKMLDDGILWEELPVEMTEGCLEVNSVEQVK